MKERERIGKRERKGEKREKRTGGNEREGDGWE